MYTCVQRGRADERVAEKEQDLDSRYPDIDEGHLSKRSF
jgi:hypothetical protein